VYETFPVSACVCGIYFVSFTFQFRFLVEGETALSSFITLNLECVIRSIYIG